MNAGNQSTRAALLHSQTPRHGLKHDAHSKKAQGVPTTTKIVKERYKQARSDHPRLYTLPFHLMFPLTTSLSFAVTRPSTVRGEHSCRDSRPLGSHTHCQASFISLAQHVQGHVAAWCHHCQLPVLQEKRDLVTGIAHVAFVRCSGRHTVVFRLSFAFTLPLWTLWAAHFPFFPQLEHLKSIPISSVFRHCMQGDERTLLTNISRETGEADARIDGKG